MADYIVKDTELTSVANAIRTAGGTNSLLSFPNGFVSAVGNINGGGSSDFSTVSVTFDGNNEITSTDPLPILEEGSMVTTSFGYDDTYAMVIYKGSLTSQFSSYEKFSVSGDAVINWQDVNFDTGENVAEITITGNCTITAKAQP